MSNTYTPLFERTLDAFKKDLSKKERASFQFSSLQELEKCLATLQATQQSQRRVQNLNRLRPFLEAMDQFGKVVETFCNSSDFVPFVWVSDLQLQVFRVDFQTDLDRDRPNSCCR
jgi:hypothetical protein